MALERRETSGNIKICARVSAAVRSAVIRSTVETINTQINNTRIKQNNTRINMQSDQRNQTVQVGERR